MNTGIARVRCDEVSDDPGRDFRTCAHFAMYPHGSVRMVDDSSPRSTDRRQHRHGGRILILTRAQADIEVYGDALFAAGFCVLYVGGAAEAYLVASNLVLSAVVTGLDRESWASAGELALRMRANPRFAQLPIIFLGGDSVSRRDPLSIEHIQDDDERVVVMGEMCRPDAFAVLITTIVGTRRLRESGRCTPAM